MSNELFSFLFKPESPEHNDYQGVLLGILSCIILAFNAAGQLHLSLLGLVSLIALFVFLGLVGGYWFLASIHVLGRIFQTYTHNALTPAPKHQPWLTILKGLWPCILLGPAFSAQRWCPPFGALMSLGVLISSGFMLVAAIRFAYNIRWFYAGLCLGITCILGSLAIAVLLGWPLMLLLGAKYFSSTLST